MGQDVFTAAAAAKNFLDGAVMTEEKTGTLTGCSAASVKAVKHPIKAEGTSCFNTQPMKQR